ncbi:MAG: hypothetical protein R2941_09920 [Desulfobacterales bacterium]
MSRVFLIGFLFVFLILATMKNWRLAVGVFAVLAAGLVFLFYGSMEKLEGKGGKQTELLNVRILYGEMHRNLFHDPEFRELLKRRYAITLSGNMVHMQELTDVPVEKLDGIWPSGMQSVHVFEKGHPDLKYTLHPLFRSPLVICSRPETAAVLMQKGLAEKQGDGLVFSGMVSLLQMMAAGKTWADSGFSQTEGKLRIAGLSSSAETDTGVFSTVLMAQALRQGNLSAADFSGPFLTTLRQIAHDMRTSEKTSDDLFAQYIKQGQWSFPLILVEECHVPAFYQAFPKYRDTVAQQVRVLMPEPIIVQHFPFLSLGQAGEKLAHALSDPELHQFVMKKCGFRSELKTDVPLPEIFEFPDLPEKIGNPFSVSPEITDAVMSAFLSES